jgi:hypothetical protein
MSILPYQFLRKAYPRRGSGLPYNVFCTGEGEGKGKRKASIEEDESANKKLVSEGGIAEVSTNSIKNLNLKKLQEVNGQMNETAQELDSVKKDLKDVRQTITINDHLSEDQKQKNMALRIPEGSK